MKQISTGARAPTPGQFARRTLQKTSWTSPLRISKLSGELLTETDARQHRTVEDLLTHLEPYCGVPKQRIRLLHAGHKLRRGKLRVGATADMQAIIMPYIEMLEGSKEAEDFRIALWERHTEKLEKLLWRPIDPNTVFRQGYLSPTSAVEMLLMNYEPQEPNWPTSALRALLQAKAELDRPENIDLLILAVKFGQTGYVQMLLDHRASVHGSADPWTPLDIACQYHPEDLSGHAPRPGLITMLLTAQADPEPMLRDASSWVLNPAPTDYFRLATPRMLGDTVALACAAAAHSNPTFMQQVVRAAQTPAIPRDPGSSSSSSSKVAETYVLSASLCSAACTGNTQNVRWLLEMQVQADAHVCTSILKGRPDLVRNERQQRTALGLAAANGHCTATQALLEARADTNLSLDGYPPLHRAALHEAPAAIISSILAAAGKVNGKDKLGRTALTLAVLWTGARDTTVIRILLEAKADRFHRDYNGHTPLSTAAKCPSAELTELMQIPEEEEDARPQTPNNLHCLYRELQQCRSSDSSEEEI